MDSRWKDIYRNLKADGFDVYSPGQHQGDCTSPYVVVKDAGSSRFENFSSSRHLYDVLCYVPKEQYSQLEPFVRRVETSMGKLNPMIRPTHYKTPSFYDDTVKGHMVSIQYINYRKF